MGRMPRILVVDDEPNVCAGLRLSLERAMQCQVSCVNDGKEALRLARTERPDVILLDVLMPGMTGGEVAEALRESPATRDIPVVFLTGLVARDELEKRGGEIGGERYLAKPASVDELKAVLAEVLRAAK